MSRRWFNNFMAACFVILFLTALVFLSGCSGQGVRLDVETTDTPCGDKKVTFSTDYQVEELEIGREIAGGDEGGGCGGGYTVSLGKGTTKDAEVGMMLEMLRMILTMVPGLTPPDAPPPGDGQ